MTKPGDQTNEAQGILAERTYDPVLRMFYIRFTNGRRFRLIGAFTPTKIGDPVRIVYDGLGNLVSLEKPNGAT